MDVLLKRFIPIIQAYYSKNKPSHDLSHALLVYNNVCSICRKESLDSLASRIGALFHDIIQSSEKSSKDIEQSALIAKATLNKIPEFSEHSQYVYKVIFEAGWENFTQGTKSTSIDTYILRDADWLESIGAHGIARAFSFAGENNIPFGINISNTDRNTVYKHFQDKLLIVKDNLYFKSSIIEAEKRTNFLNYYLESYTSESKW